MINTVPITALQMAVYQMLTKCISGYPILDDSTPFEDGKLLGDKLCIIGPITAVPQTTKKDTVMWDTTITIDLYSSYRGKKEVNEMINDVACVLTCADLNLDNYHFLNGAVEMVEVRAEDWNDDAIWQHGSVRINFKVEQQMI